MRKLFLFVLGFILSFAVAEGKTPSRVLSLTPGVTDMIQSIGAEHTLAGISDYCVWNSSLPVPPRIGKTLSPSKEEILRLKPDMVFLYVEQQNIISFLDQAGISYKAFHHQKLGDIYDTLYQLGEIFGREAEAADQVRRIKALILRTEKSVVCREPRSRILLIVGREPGSLKNIYAVGTGDFLNELLESLCVENAYQGSLPYPRLSLEGLAALDPDLIVEILPDLAKVYGTDALKKDWLRGAPYLRAVRDGKIREAPADLRVEPSTAVIDLIHALKEMIYAD